MLERFDNLPHELKLMIFYYLHLKDVKSIFLVNKCSNAAIKDNLFWKAMYKYYYPGLLQDLTHQENIDWQHKFREAHRLRLNKQILLDYLYLCIQLIQKQPVTFGSRNLVPSKIKQIHDIISPLESDSEFSKWLDAIFELRNVAEELSNLKSTSHYTLAQTCNAIAALIVAMLKTKEAWKTQLNVLKHRVADLESKIKFQHQNGNSDESLEEELNVTIIKLANLCEGEFFLKANTAKLFSRRLQYTFTYHGDEVIPEQFKSDYFKKVYVQIFEKESILPFEAFQTKSLAKIQQNQASFTHKK